MKSSKGVMRKTGETFCHDVYDVPFANVVSIEPFKLDGSRRIPADVVQRVVNGVQGFAFMCVGRVIVGKKEWQEWKNANDEMKWQAATNDWDNYEWVPHAEARND
jgi:hypothetical protein